jgi:hypothetical protein
LKQETKPWWRNFLHKSTSPIPDSTAFSSLHAVRLGVAAVIIAIMDKITIDFQKALPHVK